MGLSGLGYDLPQNSWLHGLFRIEHEDQWDQGVHLAGGEVSVSGQICCASTNKHGLLKNPPFTSMNLHDFAIYISVRIMN